MVRFLNDTTIAVADYPIDYKEGKKFMDNIYSYLKKILPDYEIIRVLNETPKDLDKINSFPNAFGNYINFMVIGETIFIPQYGITEKDKLAIKTYSEYFDKIILVDEDIDKLSALGGVLNCITWNY
jgi:agmatine/peptidylarginine deiminase